MRALGYPRRESSQADGEYFREQKTLALRRLRSQRVTGRYDGLYLVGNQPLVLCEVKRYDELDGAQLERAVHQLQDYARSEDFASPPPFLALYCGKLERTRFFRLNRLADGTLLGEADYEDLGAEIWQWERVKAIQLVTSAAPPPILSPFGRWLLDRSQAQVRMRALYERKVAKTGKTRAEQV